MERRILDKLFKKNKKGFSLIEAMTVLFIFCIITITFYEVLNYGLSVSVDAKKRLGAVALANEKMEIIRNIKYENIGTVEGAVSGNILDDQDVMENAGQYHVNTLVEYVQDPLDGVYPADIAFEDYKKVTVTVTWSEDPNKQVKLVSRFVPAGLEVANPGDGILLVNVFSDQPGGSGIANSKVHVVNSETGLNTTVYTDSTGSVALMGNRIKNSIQKYEISLSKSDYESVNTMPPYPTTTYDPINVHASVVVGSINVINIIQNKLADFKVATVDYLDQPIADIDFHLEGGKILGNTRADDLADPPVLSEPVYNINTDEQTGSNGEKDFGSVSPGQFFFTLSDSMTDYELVDMLVNQPTDYVSVPSVSLFSDDDKTLKIRLAKKDETSLLVKVVSSLTDNPPITGASVKLSNGDGYDVTVTASAIGTAFFPVTADVFAAGTYDLKITAEGFLDSNTQVTVNADELKTETITLTSN